MMKYLKFQCKRKVFILACNFRVGSPLRLGGCGRTEQSCPGSKSRDYLCIHDVPPLYLILPQGASIEDGVARFQASEACLESIHTDTPISILHRFSRQFSIQINLIEINHQVWFLLCLCLNFFIIKCSEKHFR